MVDGTVVAICQHGGEFSTNSDGTLSYSGGEARAVDVSQDMLLEEFKAEIAATFEIDTSGWTIKYLLPGNRRVLISISSDKDLQRMVSYHKSAMSTEVFIINSHNRGTMGGAANSGTSVVASSQNGKRRRPATGARENKRTLLENSSMKHTATKAFNVAVDNARQNGAYTQSEVENIENSAMSEHMMIHSGFPNFMTAEEQGMTTINNYDDRSALIDPSTPPSAALATSDEVGPLNLSAHWGDIITGVGQEFDNVKEFRSQLCKFSIAKGFVYKFVKNESTRVTVKCSEENCQWRIHASESTQKQKFIIKKMNETHTCGLGNGKDGQRRATRQWLTSILKEKLQAHNPCKPKEVVKEIFDEYGVTLSYSQVWRGREDAQKELYSLIKETYSQLPWLCQRIIETNPGSIALLSATADSKVRRFFVTFHASLHGFVKGCRPLIFLDRIPLKSNTECKLLTAAALDGDDAVFPLAFAAVEDENYDSWAWFLTQVRYALRDTDLTTFDSRVITFVSNRQKGLDMAVPNVFIDDCHHSYCLRHLIEDFKSELKRLGPWSQQFKDQMVDDFIRAAQACTIEDFNACIESIRSISDEVADWVMDSKPENWSDALFRGARYEHLSCNIVDSFNNWIPVKSESTLVQIVESIRNRLMETIEQRREGSCTWTGALTPSMEQRLEKEVVKARKLNVLCSSETVFEVRGNMIYVVNIGTWECTCRRWQISGLPCMHAVAVFNRVNRSVYEFCSRYFTVESYCLTYSESVHPIPDVDVLEASGEGGEFYPPAARRSNSGRPRRRRFNPNKVVSVVRLCSRCKAVGHNKATCEAFL